MGNEYYATLKKNGLLARIEIDTTYNTHLICFTLWKEREKRIKPRLPSETKCQCSKDPTWWSDSFNSDECRNSPSHPGLLRAKASCLA